MIFVGGGYFVRYSPLPCSLAWDAFGEKNSTVNAPCAGMVIGSLQNPLVNQGDAIFHIAVVEDQFRGSVLDD